MSDNFEPKNDLEQQLLDAQEGNLDGDVFLHQLMHSQVFMPVKDDDAGIGGFQTSSKAIPLSLEDSDGTNVLVLFTSPERARGFLEDYPGYEGGLLERFGKVIELMGIGYAITLNPGCEAGMDLDPDMVTHLAQTTFTEH